MKPSFDHPPPIKVYYPFGGRHFLLNWVTEHDQGHLFVARSEKAIEKMFTHILDETPEIKAFCEVEIVAPSRRLCREAAERAYQTDVENFMNQLVWRLREVAKAGLPLPSMFSICDKFEDSDDPERALTDEDDIHYECKNCYEGVRLNEVSKEELYTRYSERWNREVDPSTPYVDEKLCVSLARQAEDDEEILAVVGDYGHHQDGIYLGEREWSNQPILFFFELVRDLDRKPYIARVEALIQVRKEAEEKRRSEYSKESTNEHNENVEKVLAFFQKEKS